MELGIYKVAKSVSLLCFVIVLICIGPSKVYGETYTLGDTLPVISLDDQHGKALTLDDNCQILVFGRGMAGSKVISEAMEVIQAKGQALPLYFADIQAMPTLIAKFIAVPKMQDLGYRIGLDYEGTATKVIASKEAHATLIRLDKRKIVQLEFVGAVNELVSIITGKPIK